MAAGSEPLSRLQRWLVVGVVLGCSLYAFLLWRWGQATGITAPLGEDGPLWSATARLAGRGGTLGMPPLYPRLTSLLSWGSLAEGGRLVNALSVVLVGLFAALAAARAAPAGPMRAVCIVLAPLLALSLGNPCGYAWYVHPELLTAATLVGVAAAGVWFAAAPTALRAVALGLACGAALTAKEHGMVVTALAVPGVLLLGRGRFRARGKLWLVWGAALALVLLLTAQGLSFNALSGAVSWGRLNMVMRDSMSWASANPDRPQMIPGEMSAKDAEAVGSGGFTGVITGKAAVGMLGWGAAYLLALVGMVGLLVLRRWRLAGALSLSLLTILPSVVVWTEPRHFMVVAPVAAVCGLVGLAHLLVVCHARSAAVVLGCAGVALVGWSAPAVYASLDTRLAEAARFQQRYADDFQVLDWLDRNAPECSALRSEGDPKILGKTGFVPDGPRPPLNGALNCRTYARFRVTRGNPVAGWRRVFNAGNLVVYRKP